MIERIDGPTPNGGTYMTVAYCNSDRTPVDKDSATLIFITEFDKNDVEINQVWGTINKQA